ncbi:MAG: class I SAM-dependent methyltransferase [Cyanobacteria bacterium P01_G01_bin.67]
MTKSTIQNIDDINKSKIWGHLKNTWGMGERLIPKAMVDDPTNNKLVEISFRHYEIASRYANGKRVLDIACGTGYGSQILTLAGAQNVVAVDVCPDTIKYAKVHYQVPNLQFICSDAEQFDWSDEFDLVCSFETLEHLPHPEIFLERIHKKLTPEGNLLISVPLGETRHIDPYHLHTFSQDAVFSLLDKSGFTVDLYRCDQWNITRRDLRRMKHLYPDSQPSLRDWLLTRRGLRALYDIIFANGFHIPQLMVTARKKPIS